MKAKILSLFVVFSVFFNQYSIAAVTKTTLPNATVNNFLFIENNTDDNYFVTPLGALDPRITGANRWTGLKYQGSGTIYQQSLGYIDNGYNTGLVANYLFDMWLENASISYPLIGLRCINWYGGCNIDTSLITPQTTDEKGFYGAKVTPGGAKWMHGMMSDSFYQYLKQMPLNSTLSMQINGCQTNQSYDASKGERCKDQSSGTWYTRNVFHKKGAHLSLYNTDGISEIFVNSDGIPLIGEGNTDCKLTTIGRLNGIACKMVNYELQSNDSNTSIQVSPSINNAAVSSGIANTDLQFSLNGNTWKNINQNYTFNELKGSHEMYIFLSSGFFKQMIKAGLSDTTTRDLFNIRFRNTTSPESGWYEFSTSNTLIIKPRDFSVSIISSDYKLNPHKEGVVSSESDAIEFDYIVTTSGITNADEVFISVEGPNYTTDNRTYCLFSSDDNQIKVPFPAYLTFITTNGKETKEAGCNSVWYDMTNALWTSTPWNDISGDIGFLNKSTVSFIIPMNEKISRKTIETDGEKNGWWGEVSASGKIHVKATWKNVK